MTDTKAMSEVALKPCPFCGGANLAFGHTRATDTLSYWSVECIGCGVEVADDESGPEAVRHWNTRTPADADVERVARAIHDVKGGLNYDYMDFCRDAALAAMGAIGEKP